jgi:hypothetical protein
MHNTERMTRFDDLNYSPDEIASFPFAVMTSLKDPVEELTSCTKLHDHIYIRGILVCTFDGHNVALPRQMVQYLNLSPHIFHILGRDELPFGYGFAGIWSAGRFLDA